MAPSVANDITTTQRGAFYELNTYTMCGTTRDRTTMWCHLQAIDITATQRGTFRN